MTTYTDDGDGADVAIGGLPFKVAITKDQPYERATAQFRKDQLDSSPTVGDQSLTGWWTRGQLSFHKGAGVTYYEVLEGDSVLNRFKDCNALAVSTPGKATLLPNLVDLSLAATDAVPAPLSAGSGVYALTSAGVKYTAGSTATTIATSDGAIPTAITSSGSRYFVANGTKIERQYDATEARTNHVTNPSFETGMTGWTFTSSGAHGGMSTSTNHAKYGSQSLSSSHGGWSEDHTFTHTLTGLTIGQTYVASVWVYAQTGNGGIYTTALKIDSTVIGTSLTADAWVRISGTFTATATSHSLAVKNGPSVGSSTGTAPATSYIYFDAVMFTEAPYANDYFDGSQPGCAWAGTPNNSKSTYVTSTNNASVVRITLSGGGTWKGVWWAKGRLWAVDSAGYWYALPDAGATVTTTDAFWNSGKTGVRWSLTEGTGPVYISDGFDIYSVTVGTDGVVPTLSTPTTAARMPLGEEIARISYYLGTLIIPTTRGIRTALTQDADVLLGPLVTTGDFSTSNRIGVYDTKAYVVGRPDGRGGDNVLCVIDLGQTVADLVPAWAPQATVSTLASTASGAVVDASGKLYTWAANTLLASSRDELSSTGYLTTGFHRFGTLEPKQFKSVLVRLGGTGGTVQVYRVDADGTQTAIGSPITVPVTSAQDISIGLAAPAEMVGLKFVLNRDASDSTKGPELLGYQLRALPAPKRQRMIRVPLMCNDVERRGGAPATGHLGGAWERLSALETMEATGATVTYQDFRTGENVEVFVEQVEHRGVNPPGATTSGFGGVVFVTLRVL